MSNGDYNTQKCTGFLNMTKQLENEQIEDNSIAVNMKNGFSKT